MEQKQINQYKDGNLYNDSQDKCEILIPAVIYRWSTS